MYLPAYFSCIVIVVSFIVGVDVDVGVGTVRAVVLGVLDVAIGIRSFDFVGVFIEFCVVDGSAKLFDKATDKTKIINIYTLLVWTVYSQLT